MLGYILSYLFTPSGRFRRVDYHLVIWSITFFIFALVMGIFGFMMHKGLGALLTPAALAAKPLATGAEGGLDISFGTDILVVAGAGFLLYIMAYVAAIMATIKRFHDFGMSGWWTLLLYFPLPLFMLVALFRFMDWQIAEIVLSLVWLVAILWYTVKLMFFKGVKADNFYGPDPYIDTPPYVGQALMIVGIMFAMAVGSVFASVAAIKQFADEMQKSKAAAEEKAKPALTPEQRAALAAEEAKKAEEERKQADKKMLERALAGDAAAQYDIASRYFTGSNGVPLDYAKAGAWLQKSAEQDHAPAQYNLGLLYFEGKGYAVDNARAYFWATRATYRGHIPQGNDYRVQAGQLLTPEVRAQVEKAAHEWKPVVKAPPAAPVIAAPPQPAPVPVPAPAPAVSPQPAAP
ncbi:MAG: SEL1-like repeat protein [Alphaproteobacteria bacterium]|nr:SEL1-like repeat protein [Alphaproteobacteria bacterium]